MSKPKGYYTDKERRVRPIFDKHTHIRPIAPNARADLHIPKRTINRMRKQPDKETEKEDSKAKVATAAIAEKAQSASIEEPKSKEPEDSKKQKREEKESQKP